jgi:hypothetical protein
VSYVQYVKGDDGSVRSSEDVERIVQGKMRTIKGFYEQGRVPGVPGVPLVLVLGRKL